jgi:hypothetical protein
VTIDLIRPRGRHRLTYWGRVVVYVRFHLYYVNRGLLVLAAAVVSGLITGAFIAIMQAVN